MQKGRDFPAIITAHNWTRFVAVRSYESTALTTGGLGSKHSTPELRPLAVRMQAGAPAG